MYRLNYSDVIITTIASQIPSLTIVYSIVYSDADQRKHQSSAWLAFVLGIHRWPVNSPQKRPVTRKMFPFDDAIMWSENCTCYAKLLYSFINYKIQFYMGLLNIKSGWYGGNKIRIMLHHFLHQRWHLLPCTIVVDHGPCLPCIVQ